MLPEAPDTVLLAAVVTGAPVAVLPLPLLLLLLPPWWWWCERMAEKACCAAARLPLCSAWPICASGLLALALLLGLLMEAPLLLPVSCA
jgi:hypothetical protein